MIVAPKKAIVMAASQGIGRAIAERFAASDVALAICSRNREQIDGAAAELKREYAVDVYPLVCDITDPDSLVGFMDQALEALGGEVDVLVTNVGGPLAGETLSHTKDVWTQAYHAIIGSVVEGCRKVVPALVARGGGTVISIGSTSAKQYLPEMALSNCFRPALAALIKNLAMEYASQNILFYNILPGNILTRRIEELGRIRMKREGIDLKALKDSWNNRTPFKRMGTPEEVAKLAWVLATHQLSYSSGISIPVDGALTTAL